RRGAAAAAARAAHPRVPRQQQGLPRDEDADIKLRLRSVQRRHRRERRGEPHQQAAQAAAPPPGLRSDRLPALSGLPPPPVLRLRVGRWASDPRLSAAGSRESPGRPFGLRCPLPTACSLYPTADCLFATAPPPSSSAQAASG